MKTKICSKCKSEKSILEFSKNRTRKDGFQHYCNSCKSDNYKKNREKIRIHQKEYRIKNREKILLQKKEYRKNNNEKITEGKRKHYQKNRSVLIAKSIDWGIKNPEKRKIISNRWANSNKEQIKNYRAKNREWIIAKSIKWQKDNPEKVNAKGARYRAKKINATPPYADINAIARKYRTAHILSKMLGRKFHVDHIVPLNNSLVCGFHHEDNLQIISAERNMRKSNKFEPISTDFKTRR